MFNSGSGFDAVGVAWWIAAASSAVAVGAVLQMWATKWSWKIFLAVTPALGGFLWMLAAGARRGYNLPTVLQLYTVAMLAALITMGIFGRYLRKQVALIRAGGTAQTTSPRQVVVFVLTFLVVAIATGAGLETLMPE